MRNAEYDDTYDAASARRSRRRKQAIVGLAGLAAILGGASFAVTSDLVGGNDKADVRDIGALAPAAPTERPSSRRPTPPPAVPPRAPAKSGAPVTTTPSPTPSPTPTPTTSADRIRDARSAAASASNRVRRPLPPANGQAAVAASDVTVTDSGSLSSGGTLRVISARGDLTGQRELAWAADDGEAVGAARCTQRFRFSMDVPAAERPTALLCWRTSATRSVVTLAVSASGRPSKAASVAVLEKRWKQLT